MDLIETEFYLKNMLKGVIHEDDLNSSGPLIFELKNKFDFSDVDICKICYNCPSILTMNRSSVYNNLNTLSQYFNLKDVEFKYLVLKSPFILVLDEQYIRNKIDLISVVFGCSYKDSLTLIYRMPDLFFIKKDYVLKQVGMLIEEFNEYGLKIRELLRREPNLLFVEKKRIINIKKVLMKIFTLSEEESLLVIKNNLEIINLGEKYLLSKFNFYYKNYFIKRDLKEILVKCPEFIGLSVEEFDKKFKQLQSLFNVDKKKVLDFVRLTPNILFYNCPVQRIQNFLKYNISSKYVLSFPSICDMNEISLPVKFIIARMLNLEKRFNEICEFDSNLFISRFLFMQSYGFFTHEDLLESEEVFKEKYHISSKLLLLSYKLDDKILNNLCFSYVNMRDKIRRWSDLVFPNEDQILKYYYGNLSKTLRPKFGYLNVREKELVSKRVFEINNILAELGLSDDESSMIFNKNLFLKKYNCVDLKKIIIEIQKQGFFQEEIIDLLKNKSYIFNLNLREFEVVLSEICQRENCNTKEAIKKYM